MARKRKVPKSPEDRLAECETHLYFLWDARRLYPKENDRYKQIAAELRVLVADHHPKKRLLLSLMDEYGFSYEVQPPGEPLDKSPIPMVGWRKDPQNKALTSKIENALGDEAALKEIQEEQAAMRQPVPLPEYIEKALAVYIAPFDYSYGDLVRAVAQQVGSSHEDTKVDEPLIQMQKIQIGGTEAHIAPLIGFADLVLQVGSQFIDFIAEKYGYSPKYFQNNTNTS